MATEKRRKQSGAKPSGKSGGKTARGRTSAPRKAAGRRRRRASQGRRLAIAIAECVVLLAVTGVVLFLLNRQPAGQLTKVYTAVIPAPGEGTVVLSDGSIFTGADGGPCLYTVEKRDGHTYVRAVSVQTQPYDAGRSAISGMTEFDVPYVMAADGPLQDGAEVTVAK